MVNVLRAALIGCKGPGELHASAYQRCRYVQLLKVADYVKEHADLLALKYEHLGVRPYSFEEALADPEIDIIDLAVPTQFHSEYAIRAAEAGKHCICEKPLALGEDEFARMTQAFNRSRTVLGGIFQYRFADEAIKLREQIRSKELGIIGMASSTTNWWRDASYFDPPQRRTYEAAGGGVLMVQAVHAIDLLIQLLGNPVSVSALTQIGGDDLPSYVEVEHTAKATILFEGGAQAYINATIRDKSISAEGDHMSRMADEKHIITVAGTRGLRTIGEHLAKDPAELFSRNIDHVAESILLGQEPWVCGESVMGTVRLIQAMYRSAGNGGSAVEL